MSNANRKCKKQSIEEFKQATEHRWKKWYEMHIKNTPPSPRHARELHKYQLECIQNHETNIRYYIEADLNNPKKTSAEKNAGIKHIESERISIEYRKKMVKYLEKHLH